MSFDLKYKITPILLASLSFLLYFWFFYFQQRSEFLKLFLVYALLFALFLRLLAHYKNNLKALGLIALIFRLLCLISLPNLSQDFYRFIWDGRLITEGINPYIFTPVSFVTSQSASISQSEILIAGMGELSATNFSNYPPLNQLIFLLSGWIAPNSILGAVIVMRCIIILADIGVFYFGTKILKQLNLPVHSIFLYLLNPFIIIELSGNLHFEGVMIFFLVLSLYLLLQKKWIKAGLAIGASISVKLLPLILLPIFFKWLKYNKNYNVNISKLIGFYGVAILLVVLSFLPFLNENLVSNYSNTIALWFQNFEFNASIYYLVRELGYHASGYNQIALIGKISAIMVIVAILLLTFLRNNSNFKILLTSFLLALSFYFFTATTVHPWYISTLLILGVFTGNKYPLLWSFTIMLSYSAYATEIAKESFWVLLCQYIPVYALFFWEILIKHQPNYKLKMPH